jgi:hypothetical protein
VIDTNTRPNGKADEVEKPKELKLQVALGSEH